jgi:hypothetical protein
MFSASALRAQIEAALAKRIPSALTPVLRIIRPNRAYRHHGVHGHRSRGSGARTIPIHFEQRHSVAKAAAKSNECQLAEPHHSTQIAPANLQHQ